MPGSSPAGPRGGTNGDSTPRTTEPRPRSWPARPTTCSHGTTTGQRSSVRSECWTARYRTSRRHVFLHPEALTVYPDWVDAADEQVSRLRAATARWGDDDDFVALMDELHNSPDFTARWSTFPTAEKRRSTTRIVHPDLGRLRLDYEVLLLPDDVDEQRLITWLPADDATAVGFARAGSAAVPTSPAQLPRHRLANRVAAGYALIASAVFEVGEDPLEHRGELVDLLV